MGVPLSRRAIKGGWSLSPVQISEESHEERPFYIGKPLTDRVKNYIGIVGPNFGVKNCTAKMYQAMYRGCNKWNGFYPGSNFEEPWPKDMSPWL